MKLKSEELEKEFNEVGAIKIPKFLPNSALSEIKKLYDELDLENLKHTYTNVKDQSSEYNNKVTQTFIRLSEQSIKNVFIDYQIGGGAFLIKGIGEKSQALLHQDWTVVDENKYQSAVIFCPIHDVDEKNGCIQVLEGSHKWFNNIRGLHNPSPIMEFKNIKKGLVPFHLKAGDALIFKHNLIHGSKPNYTSNNRVAAMISIASKKAEYIHYLKDENEFKILKADANFFNINFSKFKSNKSVDVEVFKRIKIKEGMILGLSDYVEAYNKRYPSGMLSKMKSFFER
jgi:hypothetical protein